MLTVTNNVIEICKYKIAAGDVVFYTNTIPEGAEFEELDISGEMFLDGAACPDIQTAHEWLKLGKTAYKKMKRDEIVRLKMAEFYPNITDEIAILYRGTDEEKALHEQMYVEACAYADEVTS